MAMGKRRSFLRRIDDILAVLEVGVKGLAQYLSNSKPVRFLRLRWNIWKDLEFVKHFTSCQFNMIRGQHPRTPSGVAGRFPLCSAPLWSSEAKK